VTSAAIKGAEVGISNDDSAHAAVRPVCMLMWERKRIDRVPKYVVGEVSPPWH